MSDEYPDRKSSRRRDGTFTYAKKGDHAAMVVAAKAILTRNPGWEIHLNGDVDHLDGEIRREGRPIGVFEYKHRSDPLLKDEPLYLNVRKCVAGYMTSSLAERSSFVLAIGFSHGLYYCMLNMHYRLLRSHKLGGCKTVVKSPIDAWEPLVKFPTSSLQKLASNEEARGYADWYDMHGALPNGGPVGQTVGQPLSLPNKRRLAFPSQSASCWPGSFLAGVGASKRVI